MSEGGVGLGLEGRDAVPDGEPMAAEPVRVLVVDDHQTFAELLALALEGQPSLSYVGHANTAEQAMRLVVELRPDVVLMDVQLPDLDGITATERLRGQHPDVRVVVLTAHSEPALVARAAAAGAAGFLTKDGALGDVLHALHTAHGGGMTVSAHLLAGLLTNSPTVTAAPTSQAAGLTSREYDVLRLMGNGLDVRSIAQNLGISPHTCRGYVKNVLAKLDAHSQLEAVVIATRRGLLP
jgi:DNA-binding NarL/FixJ family response regulator